MKTKKLHEIRGNEPNIRVGTKKATIQQGFKTETGKGKHTPSQLPHSTNVA